MTPLKRRIAAVSVPALLALSLTACGGGAPTDASKADFCKGFTDAQSSISADEEDPGKIADALKEQSDDLKEIGTPENISDDAREGFEIYIDKVGDVSEDDVQKLLDGDADDENDALGISKDDEDKVEKFFEYQAKECADA